MIIALKERFGDFIFSSSEGRGLGQEIVAALEDGEDVELNFDGVRSVVSAFLNPAVGDLYASFPIATVDQRVRALNANAMQARSLEMVRAHARRYYHDAAYRHAQDQALDELFTA